MKYLRNIFNIGEMSRCLKIGILAVDLNVINKTGKKLNGPVNIPFKTGTVQYLSS